MRHCSASGCDGEFIPLSRATSVRALDLSLIPDLPAASVKFLGNLNGDSAIDKLSLAPSGGTYHLQLDFGNNGGTPDFDYDTGILTSQVPSQFDLSWTVTVRDFDGDGTDDIISAFAGFAPVVLFGGSTLRAPTIPPFSSGISYGAFSVADINGDEKADLIAQNTVTGGVETFLGSDTGIVRVINVPEECHGSGALQPHALAVAAIPSALGIPVPHAIFDCPGPNDLNQLMYFDLLAQTKVKIQPLTAGGNWRAFAYRRVQQDMLALSDNDTEYTVYSIALNDPVPLKLFTKPIAGGDRIGGLTWNEEDLHVHVVVNHRPFVPFDTGDSEIQIFNESGSTAGTGRVFADCRNPFPPDDPTVPAKTPGLAGGLVAGAGADTVSCAIHSLDPATIPMVVGTNGAVTRQPTYLHGGPFDGQVGDIECDPLGGLLWGMSASGHSLYAKQIDFITICPFPGFAIPPGFNMLSPMASGEWRATGLTLPVGADHSLLVNHAGNTTITGPLIAASYLKTIGTEIDVDVLVPSTPGAPAWAGTVQLLLSTPQSPNQSVGTVDMTPLSRGQWHTLRFPLSSTQSAAFANGVRDVSFSVVTNLPASPEPLHVGSLRFAGTLTTRPTVPTEDPYAREPVFGFEDATLWRSTAALARDTSSVTQGSAALRVTGGNYNEITSRTFRTDGLLPGSSLKVDVFVPNTQPNPYWFGDVSAYVSCPSAGVNNTFLATRPLTGLPRNRYSTLTFTLPANVKDALGSKRNDCTVKLALNVPTNAAPHRFDNLRFQ